MFPALLLGLLPAAPAPVQRQTLVASMVPSAAQPALLLDFSGESWVEILGPEGRTLE